ncbi:MAG: hypothetical protein C5B48_02580 [Candidatus Rokuibacteriota bacterium]|nr:MAG: hypothetical protein C5B48_02580 [Candidatus Rokubacteria bacterium]
MRDVSDFDRIADRRWERGALVHGHNGRGHTMASDTPIVTMSPRQLRPRSRDVAPPARCPGGTAHGYARRVRIQDRRLMLVAYLARIALLALAASGLGLVEARAASCDAAALCPSTPCTISGTHHFTSYCALDFSGKDVSVDPSALLDALPAQSGTWLNIKARNLTVQGVIHLPGGTLQLDVEQSLRTGQSPGIGLLSVTADADRYVEGRVDIKAGDEVVLSGSEVYAASGAESGVWIVARNVLIDSPVRTAGGRDEATWIVAEAEDSIRTTKKLLVNPSWYGEVQLVTSSGDVVVEGPITKTGSMIGTIYLSAGGNLRIGAPIAVNSADGTVDYGSQVNLTAGRDIIIDGDIRARTTGRGSPSYLYVEPGLATGSGNVTITRTIDVRSPEAVGWAIDIREACNLRVSGKLLLSTAGGSDPDFGPAIELPYRESLDLTGATLRAGSSGSVAIRCRCTDTNGDYVCDGGCASPPTGLQRMHGVRRVDVFPTLLTPCR